MSCPKNVGIDAVLESGVPNYHGRERREPEESTVGEREAGDGDDESKPESKRVHHVVRARPYFPFPNERHEQRRGLDRQQTKKSNGRVAENTNMGRRELRHGVTFFYFIALLDGHRRRVRTRIRRSLLPIAVALRNFRCRAYRSQDDGGVRDRELERVLWPRGVKREQCADDVS